MIVSEGGENIVLVSLYLGSGTSSSSFLGVILFFAMRSKATGLGSSADGSAGLKGDCDTFLGPKLSPFTVKSNDLSGDFRS